jgi:hypothetical protein
MEHRGREDRGLEVIVRLEAEAQVRDVETCAGDVDRDAADGERRKDEDRTRERCQEHDGCRWKETPSSTRVEGGDIHATGTTEFAMDRARDEETREDEEDVDAHVAAAKSRDPGVVQQDQQDRDRAEALEIRAKLFVSVCESGHAGTKPLLVVSAITSDDLLYTSSPTRTESR